METENINHDCAAREEEICTCALLFGLKFKHFLIILLVIILTLQWKICNDSEGGYNKKCRFLKYDL